MVNCPRRGALLYVSTKGSIETLTKGLALELARNIRVNDIAPGQTGTEANASAEALEGGAGTALAEKSRLAGSVASVTSLPWKGSWSGESGWITGEVIRAAGG